MCFGGIKMKQCQLTVPSVIHAGQGCINQISEIINIEQAKNILIFTDKGVRGAGLCETVEKICATVSYKVIDDLTAEPAVADIERVIAEIGEAKIDLIIGVGGGSVMDASKLASIIVGADYTLRDLLKDSSIAKKHIKTIKWYLRHVVQVQKQHAMRLWLFRNRNQSREL